MAAVTAIVDPPAKTAVGLRSERGPVLGAIMLSMLALAPILFWRLLADRVVAFKNMDTFIALFLGMLVLIMAETALSSLRRHLMLVLITRIEIKLTTYVFGKVTDLPVDYFERTPAGMTLHQMRELGKIRIFLNGPLFGTLLDSFILLFFLLHGLHQPASNQGS